MEVHKILEALCHWIGEGQQGNEYLLVNFLARQRQFLFWHTGYILEMTRLFRYYSVGSLLNVATLFNESK